jgi:hypothetical protein
MTDGCIQKRRLAFVCEVGEFRLDNLQPLAGCQLRVEG